MYFGKSIDSVVRLIYGMDMTQRHQRDKTSRKRLIGIVGACVIVVIVVLVISLSGRSSAVNFPDPNLEAAIREALNKPSGAIHASELAGLANLTASDSGIEYLSGLQYCTNLTELDLWHNQISDISPLGNLTNLTYLELGDNGISDISPLANLTNLMYLYLYSNEIGDIFSIGNLTNLKSLSLQYNQVDDISPLASLTGLTELDLWSNQISDITPLANLTDLTLLYLPRNQISDVSPLVDNEGLLGGAEVYLLGNPLSADSINIYIPQLRARGVTVNY
jgi:Leucine-rich repeat (LRR) protein